MRVTITQTQSTRGFLRKTMLFQVRVEIEFSEEEKNNIKTRNLGRQVVYALDTDLDGNPETHPNLISHITIDKILKGRGQGQVFNNQHDANQWEHELRERILPGLKQLIESPTGASKTFEL
jgi:hypothetical protein